MSDPIVGIDLGTSNTVVAHADATGQVQVLPDANGYKIHPSVVSFHPTGGVVVGAAAKQRKVIDPKNTIFSVKRLIGRAFNSPEVQTAKQRMPYQIKEGQNQLPLVVTRGGEFAIPEISAIVLDHARTIASTKLQTEVSRAVVTVPASFNDAQRSATATSGSIAGLQVVRVLNEPTAAALAYGNARNLNQTIAVYDFGGGTFDITILKLADQVYEVLGTAGNTFLGGDDLDERLVDRMVEKFLMENRVDLRTNEVSMMRLRAVAEQTKIELSRRSRAVVRIDEIAYGPKGKALDLQIEIRRDEFVKQVADIIDRTFPVCEEALKYANLTLDGIDDVILVGGTTKIPYVRDQVAKFFAKAPRTDVNPEDAVAVGAAFQAKALERVLDKKSSVSQVTGVPNAVGGYEEDERTNESAGPRHARAETGTGYSLRGGHHDRLQEKAGAPPTPPAGQPVIGRLTKDIKPPPGTKTAPGVVQVPPKGAPAYATTQPLPPPLPPAKPTRKTEMAMPIVRPPAIPASSPQAKTMIGQASRESSTVIIDPSASNPGLQTSENIDFPETGTEKGFLDLDDATSPASTARGFAAPADSIDFGDLEDTAARAPQTSEDIDFPETGTEKGFLDLDDSMSPASTAKGFGQRAPAPAPPRAAPPPPAPPPAFAPPPTASPVARTMMVEPAPASLPPGPLQPPVWPPPSAQATPAARPMTQSPVVMDVTPRGLGIGTVAGYCEELIRRNSRVPTETRKLFVTSRDHQDAVRIIVCQGESRRLDNNVVIGDLLLSGLPRRPRGETSIEVTFYLDANGILQVRARDAQTGNEQRASLDLVGSVPHEEVAEARERLQALRR